MRQESGIDIRSGIHIIALLALAGSLIGCTHASDSRRSSSPMLEQVGAMLLQETDSLFIGDFWTIHVSENPWRMYVTDRILHRIAVVDDTGRILRVIGQSGQGPGELERPHQTLVVQNQVFVRSSGRFTVFDTTGALLNNLSLPPGLYPEDQWSLTHYNDRFYLGATDVNLLSSGLKAGPGDKTVAELDTSLQLLGHFGTYPEFYQQDDYVWRFRTLDVSPGGLLAVGYYLAPEVYVYDLSRTDKPLVTVIPLHHPEFKPVAGPIPINASIEELRSVASNLSFIWQTFFVDDSTLVQMFHNRTERYYPMLSEEEMSFHAMIGTTSGRVNRAITLPGPIVGKDAGGRLYIRTSNELNRREIGIFEITWTPRLPPARSAGGASR